MANHVCHFSNHAALVLTSALISLSSLACKSTNAKDQSSLASATQPTDTKSSAYTVTHYEGKVSYQTKSDAQRCQLYIYKSNKDGKIAAVRFSGGTRDFELRSYTIGGPAEENKDRTDLKNDLERTQYKELEGYTRIARSEETEKKSLTSSTLIITDVAVRDERPDWFGTVVGTEVYKIKLIGGMTMDDSSRERETVTCFGVSKVDEKGVDELPKY